MPKLISINEAARRGIERLRLPRWADKMDHIKIDIVDGRLGPWLHLWCPFNTECNGRDPVDQLLSSDWCDEPEWEVYRGPLPDSDEYKARADEFAKLAKAPEIAE